MKLAVLSDVHGNWPAFQIVADDIAHWQPNQVVVAGDVVNRGPSSAKCWEFVQRKRRDDGWLAVIGNHEEYVINQAQPSAIRAGVPFDIFRPSFWTYEQLGCDVSSFEALPFALDEALASSAVRITHASMLGTREGIFPVTPNDALPEMIGQPMPALFAVGHTHQPLVRQLNGTLVVNAGAVGMPFDRDPRASYAQMTHGNGGWRAKIVRLDYDRAQAERDFFDTGFIEGGGPLTRVMLREFQLSTGLLYTFLNRYEQRVLNGEILLNAAVEKFLEREAH